MAHEPQPPGGQPPPYPGGGQPPPYPGGGGYGHGGYGYGYGGPAGYGSGYGSGYGYGPGDRSLYVSYWLRVAGWIIDFIVVGIVSYLIDIPVNRVGVLRGDLNYTTNNGVVHHGHYSFLSVIVQVAIVLLYAGIMIGSRRGQTLGMMAVNAKAVDAADGSPIGFWRAVGRGAFEYLMAVLFFLPWVLDMLFPAWDPRRQTLHDKVARTVVVRTNVPAIGGWNQPPPGGWGPPPGGWNQPPPGGAPPPGGWGSA